MHQKDLSFHPGCDGQENICKISAPYFSDKSSNASEYSLYRWKPTHGCGRGDIINGQEFTAEARIPDPARMVQAYNQSAATLNLLRGFASGDRHSWEAWINPCFPHTALPASTCFARTGRASQYSGGRLDVFKFGVHLALSAQKQGSLCCWTSVEP